jgi:hypothetical protein
MDLDRRRLLVGLMVIFAATGASAEEASNVIQQFS